MKYFLEILLVIITLTFTSYSQQFKLTDINTMQYSIDRIGQEVYFQDFYSDTIRVVSLKNLSLRKTGRLMLLPFFGNKKHIMLYGNNSAFGDSSKDNIYLYGLDKQTSYLITDTVSFPFGANYFSSFSPNDSNFIFINDSYFSLKDSLFYPIDSNLSIEVNGISNSPQWSSDTSFVALSVNNNFIVEYFLKSRRLDTLVIADTPILGFAYNVKHNILAYSTANDTSEIYFHYKNSDKDSLIFSPFRDDPENAPCWSSGFRGITALCWSPDNKKLAFLGFQFIDISAAGIYIYSLDSNRTYKATDCNDWGNKYFLKWANNDTLVYVNATDLSIYGIDVSSVITSVEQKKNDGVITDFNISNYPNPFNPSTKIRWQSPISSHQTIKVYDVLGNEIATLIDEYKPAGMYEVEFDASQLSSGVYLFKLQAGSFVETRKMILLK